MIYYKVSQFIDTHYMYKTKSSIVTLYYGGGSLKAIILSFVGRDNYDCHR